MARLTRGLLGPRVITMPQVISRPASSGQQVDIGSVSRSTSGPSITCACQGAFSTCLGITWARRANPGTTSSADCRSSGRLGFLRNASSRPRSNRSCRFSSSSAASIRSSLPNRLPSTGVSKPRGRSNRRAGPLLIRLRRQRAVISWSGDMGLVTVFNCPVDSSASENWRRSAQAFRFTWR